MVNPAREARFSPDIFVEVIDTGRVQSRGGGSVVLSKEKVGRPSFPSMGDILQPSQELPPTIFAPRIADTRRAAQLHTTLGADQSKVVNPAWDARLHLLDDHCTRGQ